MDPFTVGAVVQGASNALNTATDWFTWRNKMKKQYEYQVELAKLQQQMSKENYDYEQSDKRNWNEYGEALGKMSDVGLNPLYMDGNMQGAGNASLGDSSIPAAPSADGIHGSPFDFLSAALKKQELKIQDKRVNKQNEESDSNIKKNLATTEELLAQKEWTEEDKKRVTLSLAAAQQGMDLRAQEMKNATDQLRLEWSKYWLSEDMFRWNKQMDEKRLGVDYINARTQMYNATTARKSFLHMMEKDTKEFQLAIVESAAKLKSLGVNDFLKYLDSYSVNGPFGTRAPGRFVQRLLAPAIAMTEAAKHPELSDKQKLELLQNADRLFDEFDLLHVEIPRMPTGLYFDDKGNYNPPKWTPATLK